MGLEGSRGFGPFHFKPKTHAEEEEVPEDEWRESRLPECTVRSRQAKITGEEGATSPEAIPLRILKEIPSPTG